MRFSAERTPTTENAEQPIRERQLAAYYKGLEYVRNVRVLELGCGEGKGASILAREAEAVVAVDYSNEALAFARKTYSRENVRFELMRLPPIDFPDSSFDVVVSFQMIEHLKEPGDLLVEISRVLNDSGKALIATVNKEESISPNPYHVHEFSFEELKNLLERHFAVVDLYGVFGDDLFMQYWTRNRQWVRAFMRFDVLGLSNRVPAPVKRKLFDFASRLMRTRLRQHDPNLCHSITHKNFLFQLGTYSGCLDFFAVCHKVRKL